MTAFLTVEDSLQLAAGIFNYGSRDQIGHSHDHLMMGIFTFYPHLLKGPPHGITAI
jgi:hypothetical protein